MQTQLTNIPTTHDDDDDDSNISGIKLRGASFLMHQVYDDEMTFKLVGAASKVSGLPVEVCLEEFGKHFLVYCQKNGYDQILRVLGSNLYDFLTNLDNLHDHLASIYPGMRAPSFRVTRHLNTNKQSGSSSDTATIKAASGDCCNHLDDLLSMERQQQQQLTPSLTISNERPGDELHKQNASCSALTSSMYLHYYSERAGLSPIVKGLVMAVAREFFQTDIVVTECQMLSGSSGERATSRANSANRPDDSNNHDDQNHDHHHHHHQDDHVVLKIDRRRGPSGGELATDKQADNESPSDAADSKSGPNDTKDPAHEANTMIGKTLAHQGDLMEGDKEEEQRHGQSKSVMLNIYDSLSTNPRESLVNSEIMMQTFPFHVIFDREFNLVQVGKSLLRVTSLFWQRQQADKQDEPTPMMDSSGPKPNPNPGPKSKPEQQQQQRTNKQPVKFGDLFRIMRPKIEFTFDAIADHTNQVFVVKTCPLVLNADYSRQTKRLSSGSSSSGSTTAAANDVHGARHLQPSAPKTLHQRPSICPFDRIAERRRQSAAQHQQPANIARPHRTSDHDDGDDDGGDGDGDDDDHGDDDDDDDDDHRPADEGPDELCGRQSWPPKEVKLSDSGVAPPSGQQSLEAMQQQNQRLAASAANSVQQQQQQTILDELGDPVNHLSLRLKGQMIVLLGGQLCLYLCSPRVDHLDQLMECGVKMSDFALHDRARELMLMSHAHKEDREAVKKLDQASNDLKKMDTKLRQENKRTNEVLHNIFPAKIASLLSHGHQVESESFELVTCLYSDIIGFTKMCGSENVKPIDIVRLLNTLYLQFDNLTNIHGVFKVETIGDAYVIVGGLPEPLEDHADRCVKMGLDMVKVIATVRSPADQQPIQMRIGIHSGPVMAGIVGIRVPRYSLFGNTTTLANQLESQGIGGKIHISDFTLKNLVNRNRFVIENNPNQISGMPFVTYFVTNYLGDKTETLKHEKILEEQLIKDFELMGDQLELVDEYQQLYAGSPAAAASAGASAGALGAAGEQSTEGLLAREAPPPPPPESPLGSPNQLAGLAAASHRQPTETGDEIGVGPFSPPAQTTTTMASGQQGGPFSVCSAPTCRPLALEALRVNFEPQEGPNQQASLAGEPHHHSSGHMATATAAKHKHQQDASKRLLMDLEDGPDKQWAERAASQLSAAIISGALKQVCEMVDMVARLELEQPLGPPASHRPPPSLPSGAKDVPSEDGNSLGCCPLCRGCGRVQANTVESAAAQVLADQSRVSGDKKQHDRETSRLERLLDEQYNKLQRQLDRISHQQAELQLGLATTTTTRGRHQQPDVGSLFSLGPTRRRSSSEGRETGPPVRARELGQPSRGPNHPKSPSPKRPSGFAVSPALSAGPLSSNMQRMKRMDTLKRRRLKTSQQQQQQQQPGGDLGGPSKVTHWGPAQVDQQRQPQVSPDQMSAASCLAPPGSERETGSLASGFQPTKLEEADEFACELEANQNGSQTSLAAPRGSKLNTGNGPDGNNRSGPTEEIDGCAPGQVMAAGRGQVAPPSGQASAPGPLAKPMGASQSGDRKRRPNQSFLYTFVSSLATNRASKNARRRESDQREPQQRRAAKSGCSCLRASDSSQSFQPKQ